MSLVEKQRVDRRKLFEHEKALEAAEAEELIRREEYRKQVIQEARRRLIEEHAAKLQGYMPRGMLNELKY